MDIRVQTGDAARYVADALVVPVAQEDRLSGIARSIDLALGGLLAQAMKSGEFTGKVGELAVFPASAKLKARRIYFVGAGPVKELAAETVRRMAGKSVRALNQGRMKSAAFTPLAPAKPFGSLAPAAAAEAFAEGALFGTYRFDHYKTGENAKPANTLTRITLLAPDSKLSSAFSEGARTGQITARGAKLTMDLANHPSAVVTPTYLGREAKQLAKTHGMKVTVMGPDQLKKLGMGGMIGVGQGSVEPPQFIVLEYHGAKSARGQKAAPVVLVGKSITFDSGGISIKPSAGMEEMKGDMSGGAAVLGTLQAAAEMKLPINVIGILTAAENMPSGTAINPGDVLKMYSGMTVEVINTDAEGRLVLADGLAWAQRYKPRLMVDIATLTGACVVALGHYAIGLLGTDDNAKKTLKEVGDQCGERVWELPLWEDYFDDLKSDIADIKNTGGRAGGTITAAVFLSKFVGDYPWVHLDIASTAWRDRGTDYLPKGSTGIGVRLMTGLLRRLAAS